MTSQGFDGKKLGLKKAEKPHPRDIRGRFRAHGSCCICGGELGQFGGNNPAPLMSMDEGRCCNDCNAMFVIPARMRDLTTA